MHDKEIQNGVESSTPWQSERTRKLLQQAAEGDEQACEELVTEHLPLVKSIVKRFMNRGYEYEDLLQTGTIGLIKAIKNYSFAYDVRFSTYAVPLITGEIKRFLRDDGAIKLSRSLKEASIAVMRGRELLFKELGREPTINELAEKCSLSPEDVVCALEASRPLVSIYEPVTDDGKSELLVLDKIASQTDESSDINDKILLTELISSLNANDRAIIVMRYFKNMTQCQVAEKLNMTQVQVSRTEKRILQSLRKQVV